MTIEFTYTVAGGERDGIVVYGDGLMGPITVYPDEESAYTYAAGYCQAGGATALFVRQEIDSIVKFRHVRDDEHPETLLARFLDEWVPDRGDLRDQLRALLGDYIGRA
jgi:hypothetical protein